MCHVPIDTITEEDIEDYILYFKEKGTVSDTTINTNLRMVRAFLYCCMDRRIYPPGDEQRAAGQDAECHLTDFGTDDPGASSRKRGLIF